MLKNIGWFAVVYASVSLTVTLLLLVFANKTFKLGGPIGMARTLVLLVLAVIGAVIWGGKSLSSSGQTRSLDDEIKHTVKKTSEFVDKLKKDWDDAKRQ